MVFRNFFHSRKCQTLYIDEMFRVMYCVADTMPSGANMMHCAANTRKIYIGTAKLSLVL